MVMALTFCETLQADLGPFERTSAPFGAGGGEGWSWLQGDR